MKTTGIDEILIDILPGETRAALLSGGRLIELRLIRPNLGGSEQQSLAGAVFRGRVTAVRREQGAAFIDIGAAKAGYLSLRKGAKPPGEGSAIVVQVTKDAVEDKGAGVSDRPMIQGRYLTLRVGQGGIERARRLDPEKFAAATQALAGLGTGTDGFVVNPAAENASAAALQAEANGLNKIWEVALKQTGTPKTLIPPPDPILRAVLDHGASIKRAAIDDAEAMGRVRGALEHLAPDLAAVVKRHGGVAALFAEHDLEQQIDEALAPAVRLQGGGRLVIDELAAMTVIDVDMAGHAGTGEQRHVAMNVNREAAAEIARHIRLRDLGGIVVVDFLRVSSADERRRVVETLRRACTGDPQQVDVLGMTPAGLVELTRRRLRPSLAALLKQPYGTGMALLRAALSRAAGPGKRVKGRAAPPVIAALEREKATLEFVRARLGKQLELTADPAQPLDRFDLVVE